MHATKHAKHLSAYCSHTTVQSQSADTVSKSNRLGASISWFLAVLRVIFLSFIHSGICSSASTGCADTTMTETASRSVRADTTMNESEKDHPENGQEPADSCC